MSGQHRAGRKLPEPDLRPDDPRWTADLNVQPRTASEAPAATEPATDPDIGMEAFPPSPEWLDAVEIDRELNGILALAEKALALAAAERAVRAQEDLRDRGRLALIKYASALPTHPYAMTAAERPEERSSERIS